MESFQLAQLSFGAGALVLAALYSSFRVKTKLDDIRSERDQAQLELEGLNAQHANVSASLERLKDDHERVRNLNTDLNGKLQASMQRINSLELAQREWDQRYQATRAELEKTNISNTTFLTNARNLETAHSNLKKIHESLKEESANLRRELAGVQAERAALQGEQAELKAQLHQAQADKASLDELVKHSLPVEERHMVLVDGMPACGKSLYIARWANPAIGWDDSSGCIGATTSHYVTAAVPLCWHTSVDGPTIVRGKPVQHTKLHTLEFWDVSGERPATFINVLVDLRDKIARERRGSDPFASTPTNVDGNRILSHEPQRVERNPRAVVLIVWNLARSSEENFKIMNQSRMDATYLSDMARQIIGSFVVLFNQADTIIDPEVLEARVKQDTKKLQEVFDTTLSLWRERVTFVTGSVKSNAGLLDVHGTILKNLGVAEHYQKVNGNPHPPSELTLGGKSRLISGTVK